MFASLFLICNWGPPNVDSKELFNKILELENSPTFIEGMNDNFSEFQSHFNVDKEVTGQSNTLREYSFFRCSITIAENTVFTSNFAFGSSTASGSGGALHLCQSVVTISKYQSSNKVKFSRNYAAVGGAICLVSSAGLIYSTDFTENSAFKYGGAIYFQGCFQKKSGQSSVYEIAPQVTLIGSGVSFKTNTACELGGALTISFAASIFFENTLFQANKGGFAGGAISSGNCDDLRLFKCQFYQNEVNAFIEKSVLKMGFPSGKIIQNEKDINSKATRFKGRGGGAISFTSDSKKGSLSEITKIKRTLNTRYCCMYQDSATYTGQTFGNGAAHELLLEGYTQWISDNDFVSGFLNEDPTYNEKSQYVSIAGRDVNFSVTGYQVYNFKGGNSKSLDNSVCISPPSSSAVITSNENTSVVPPSPNKPGNDDTSSVPSPSKYEYVATPITRLPQKTTSSQIKYVTARTAITDGQGEGDITSLLTGWTNLPGFGSFSVYSVKPLRTVRSTPHSTAHSTAHSTPHSTPHSTAHSTPHSTPHSTAHSTPNSTPHSTAHSTPHSTAHSTPHSTAHSTAHSTPHSTAHSTAHSTPHSTPYSTAHSTPHSTPHSTAHSTPHSTPHSTAHSTPHSTPNSTPHSTPHNTPFQTVERTRPPTPAQLITPKSGKTYSSTSTVIISYTSSVVNLTSGDMYFDGSTYVVVKSDGAYTVYSITTVSTLVLFGETDAIINEEPTKKGNNMWLYIGIGIGALVLLLVIGTVIFFVVAKKNDDNSETSAVEMAEETVMQVPDSTSAPVTNDNPLWTTSVMGDTDDPFKNDFEEDLAQGFFGLANRDYE